MNIYSLTREEMEEYFVSHGSKKFHADQLFSWLYEKRISSVSEITNIKKEMLEEILMIANIYLNFLIMSILKLFL